MSQEKDRASGELTRDTAAPVLPTVNPEAEKKPEPVKAAAGFHPAVYISIWIALSSSVILFNKYILDPKKLDFHYPVSLTMWHLAFATLMTQIMARFTTMLDSRHSVPMTGRVYLRAIVPIGALFSLSLICGNLTYLYLSVSFIQMLKATTPVAVLLASWVLGVASPNLRTLGNVSFIVIGVIIASFAEIQFVLIGFLFQIGGIVFEAIRLTMVERLLSSAEFKMDPLVSLYYFAPACASMNFVVAIFFEAPTMSLAELQKVGALVFLANAMVAFALNVSVVFLIGRTSSLVLTLSGVLKDIMLVVASMVIFLDPVTGIQMFGYSIALAGLVYYRLGAEKLKEYFGQGSRQWGEYGAKHPAMKKFIIFAVIVTVLFVVLGGLAPLLPSEYSSSVKAKVDHYVGSVSGKTGQ